MSELKLTQHPEITGLLSVLEQNGLHKEQNEVKCLAAYIDEMEGQLSAMNEELMQLHREISTIRDSSLKVRCEKLIFGAEKQLRQAATAIRTVKHNCLCMARNAMDTFKANGKAALRRAVFAMKNRHRGAIAGRKYRRGTVLVVVWIWKPCGMVCLLCQLVRRPVRLYRHGCLPEICRLRKWRAVVSGAWTMAGWLRRACSRHDYLLRLGQQGRLRSPGRRGGPCGYRPEGGERNHLHHRG